LRNDYLEVVDGSGDNGVASDRDGQIQGARVESCRLSGWDGKCILPAGLRGSFAVYRFTSSDYVISSVERGQLKVARFSDTNDPFELIGLMLREKGIRQALKDFKKARNNDTGLLCSVPIGPTHFCGVIMQQNMLACVSDSTCKLRARNEVRYEARGQMVRALLREQ
jgi:hypothetical protein